MSIDVKKNDAVRSLKRLNAAAKAVRSRACSSTGFRSSKIFPVIPITGNGFIKLSPEKEREREQLLEKISDFPFWYHKIQLPHGIVTPGWAPINSAAYQIPARLDGKRVLDIGAWDGYWTFEALRRGAKEVIAIDDFSDYLGALENRDRKAWETFDLCKFWRF